MGRTKSKADLHDLYNLNIEWFKSDRGIKNNIRCTRIILCKPLTQQQIDGLYYYKNTEYLQKGCTYKYAPEIRYDIIYLYDKCLKPYKKGGENYNG